MIVKAVLCVALVAAPLAAIASERPYAGLERRDLKALSPEEIAALESGQGFSQALSAELNGFPGPRHVLDLADTINLSDEQRASVGVLFRDMQAEAITVGLTVLADEVALENAFRSGQLSEGEVESRVEEIGRMRGVLRGIHLKYHLRTKVLLSPHQIKLYAAARGYADVPGHEGHGHHAD